MNSLTDKYSQASIVDEFSPENIIRRASQSAALANLPAQYAQSKPDMLSMDTDSLLASMAHPHGNPGVPYTNANYANTIPFPSKAPLPALGIDTLTNLMRKNESNGNYTALNREKAGNTASGAYQYTDSTWNGYGGYAKAMLAPREVQDRRFQEDIHNRFLKFGGDPFKTIAAHYLPIQAGNPNAWNQRSFVDHRGRSHPLNLSVAEYINHTLRGTGLQPAFAEYLKAHGGA